MKYKGKGTGANGEIANKNQQGKNSLEQVEKLACKETGYLQHSFTYTYNNLLD